MTDNVEIFTGNKRIFTPIGLDGQRMRMILNDADMAKVAIGSADWAAVVTDQQTGIAYVVRGAPCGGGCICDARVVAEATI